MKYFTWTASLLCILLIQSCKKSNPINTAPPSSAKSITSFVIRTVDNAGLVADIAGAISNDSIVLKVAYGINLRSLKPTIQHTGVSLNPASGVTQNFNSPVNYVVKAEDGTTKTYVAVISIIVKSTAYIGSADGKLYAFDGENGTLKWTYNTGGAILSSSPTYYNGTVYVGSASGYIYAVNAATGVLKWKYDGHGDLSNATPLLNNGILYFGAYAPGGINFQSAINAATGTLIWEKISADTYSSSTYYNGALYCCGIYGLFSINAATGSYLTTFSWDICRGNPLLKNGILYSATEGTIVTAYDAVTAAVKWYYNDVPAGSPTAGSRGAPTLYKGTLYNMGHSKTMYAMDSATGALKWKYIEGPNSKNFASATAANGMVYAVNADTYIYALDAATGILRWRFTDSVGVLNPPDNNCTVKNDIIYFGSYNNKFYALNALTGSVIWQYAAGGIFSGGACVVGEDGSVYHPGISGEHQ